MTEATWLAAFMLGIAGSGHCAAMCGGVTALVARAENSSVDGLRLAMTYHAGRALSYAAAGAIAGALGQAGLVLRGSLALQQTMVAFASVALVITGAYLAGFAPLAQRLEGIGSSLWRRIEPWSRALLPATTPARAFSLGVAWGWLPCGMVYGALILALSTASAAGGAAAMAAFAIGTLPSVLAAGLVARRLHRRSVSPSLRRAAAAVVFAAGIYGLVHLALHTAALQDWCGFS